MGMAGEETSVAGQSAGNTPYPNASILFKSGDDKDDDIEDAGAPMPSFPEGPYAFLPRGLPSFR
jgi:hypothetical protein